MRKINLFPKGFFLILIVFIILMFSFSFVNAAGPLIYSSALSSVYIGDTFQIQCDYGEVLPCVIGIHDTEDCSFVRFSGTNAIFNCIARNLGVKDNYCNIFSYSPVSKCIPQSNKIASTNVVNLSSVSSSDTIPLSKVNPSKASSLKLVDEIGFIQPNFIQTTSAQGNPVAYYTFEGNLNDLSGNGNNLKCVSANCPAYISGNALSFNSQKLDYLYLYDNPFLDISKNLTISAWIRYSSGAENNAKGIVTKDRAEIVFEAFR